MAGRNMAGAQLSNLSYGIQDIITVMQYGGGFERAMMAAGNNIGFILTAFGGMTGAIAGVVGTLAVGLIPKLITGGKEASTFREELDRLAESLQRVQRFSNVTISIEREFRDAGQDRDIFGQMLPEDEKLKAARGAAEAIDRKMHDVEADRLAELATQRARRGQIENKQAELTQRFIANLGSPTGVDVAGFTLDRVSLGILAEAGRNGPNISDERMREIRNYYAQAHLGQEGQKKLYEEGIAGARKLTFEELTQLFPTGGWAGSDRPQIVSKEDQKVFDELVEESRKASEALVLLKEQENALTEARQKAIENAKPLIEAEENRKADEDLREVEQRARSDRIAFESQENRRRLKEAEEQQRQQLRQQEQNRKSAIDKSLSEYEQKRNNILQSESSLLSRLAPDAAQALEVDRLLKPLQNIFGKQHPNAFAEIRGQLLAPPAAEISGQFSVPSFVDQLTSALLGADKEPINLSPEAMGLLEKIEEHLRDREGLGVAP